MFRTSRRRGFTLVEILVVILIILIVSAITLPVVIPAMRHRQVSEGARVLQAAIAGARDEALRTGQPSGIRLMPDPAFPLVYITTPGPTFGQIDPTQPLAASRIIPLSTPTPGGTGMVNLVDPVTGLDATFHARRARAYAKLRIWTAVCGGWIGQIP